ncbi:MAG: bifunctional (p)ppGpp synthetase/guanosine-3',5'-bis(diphosphate) 3'-pyrophosphohydrolase [Chloroflexi bacterium]|nr:bifunctional (p)ppGpp synthetase/guanosine-3',5'-bis(diphosphate) 3'-pyrophosphohydrolase [Chloroflexota bacterium]
MNWENLLHQLPKGYSAREIDLVRKAYDLATAAHAGQTRKSGEPYIIHPVAVACILADHRLDADTVAAALLHDVAEDTPTQVHDLVQEFGPEVAKMVDGVTKLMKISELANLPLDSRDPAVESLRKMLLATVNDVRVVLIKLADRLHNMRTMGYMTLAQQRRISRETLDIYAPLASVLGMYQFKWELEDLAFRYLEPEKYVQTEKVLVQRRAEREAYIASVSETLKAELTKRNITAQITGRPKHIYSIWCKTQRRGISVEQVYDQLGIRVIVSEPDDCYIILGVIHGLWHPVQGGLHDYIASPKDNGYSSLHTTVYGPGGQPLEVQIRTAEMNRIAEVGIAAHWRYKSQARADEAFESKVARLRSIILEWVTQEGERGDDFMTTVKENLFQDRVYVVTPKGEAIDLPTGATPIDFAYQIHTEIGHRCRGAKISGKLVNLDYQLKTSEQVEIITTKRGGPSRDWLNPHLGYVKTARARNKIRQWFRQQDREENVTAGREMLQKELDRLGMDSLTYEQIASLFGKDQVEDFLSDIGDGDISIVDVAERVLEIGKVVEPPKEAGEELPTQEAPQQPALEGEGIAVQGVRDMLTVLARCCNPMPPDEIIGYVTVGRGVSIHRRDCPNVLNLSSERIVKVDWGRATRRVSRVKIRVQAYDRAGLLNDITQILEEEKINLQDASAVTARQDNLALITATLEVRDAEQLSRVLSKIDRLPNVQEVRRQKG